MLELKRVLVIALIFFFNSSDNKNWPKFTYFTYGRAWSRNQVSPSGLNDFRVVCFAACLNSWGGDGFYLASLIDWNQISLYVSLLLLKVECKVCMCVWNPDYWGFLLLWFWSNRAFCWNTILSFEIYLEDLDTQAKCVYTFIFASKTKYTITWQCLGTSLLCSFIQ